MKWVFAGLILVNMGFWMWASWYAEPGNVSQAPEARLQFNAESIQLLTEPEVVLKTRRSRTAPTKVLTDITPPKQCFVLGRFSRETLMQRARSDLASMGLAAVLRTDKESSVTYQVYLPPFEDAKQARDMRKRLTRLGYKDHALMTEKGMEHAISLGVFAVKANANQRMNQLRRHGIKPKRKTLTRVRRYYWLDVKSENDLLDILQGHAWGETEVALQAQQCPAAK